MNINILRYPDQICSPPLSLSMLALFRLQKNVFITGIQFATIAKTARNIVAHSSSICIHYIVVSSSDRHSDRQIKQVKIKVHI